MGWPIEQGKPFNDALRIALRGGPLRLRRIAEKLAEKAVEGGLARKCKSALDPRVITLRETQAWNIDYPGTRCRDRKLTCVICFDRTGELHEPVPATCCLAFRPGPGGCPGDGMAKLRYPEYRR